MQGAEAEDAVRMRAASRRRNSVEDSRFLARGSHRCQATGAASLSLAGLSRRGAHRHLGAGAGIKLQLAVRALPAGQLRLKRQHSHAMFRSHAAQHAMLTLGALPADACFRKSHAASGRASLTTPERQVLTEARRFAQQQVHERGVSVLRAPADHQGRKQAVSRLTDELQSALLRTRPCSHAGAEHSKHTLS